MTSARSVPEFVLHGQLPKAGFREWLDAQGLKQLHLFFPEMLANQPRPLLESVDEWGE